MPIRQGGPNLTFYVTPERLALARSTHRSVNRTLLLLYSGLSMVFFTIGVALALTGRGSLWGMLAVGAAFLALALLLRFTTQRSLRLAERSLASDGSTQFVVTPSALQVGNTLLPYERITFLAAHHEDTEDLSDQRGPGAAIGSAQRRKLIQDGAKSAISLAIGVDQARSINAPEGLINPLRTLPKRGDDPGRIDVAFGAYFTAPDLEALLGAVYQATSGQAFPIATISGTLNWATVTTSACEPRPEINETFRNVLAPN